MKHRWIRYLLFAAPILTSTATAFCQEEIREVKRPAYLDISFGVSHSAFRDFATSPLRYSGRPLYTALSHIDADDERTSQITLAYTFGNYENDFNEQNSESRVNIIALNYLELYQLKRCSHSKFNLKVGGQFSTIVNLRRNEALFNNREGADIIATLFGAVRGTFNLSRKARKQFSTLSFTTNFGLINSSYRNGFAYTSASIPLNRDDFFADYELKVFQGLRLNTALDYTVYLPNKNAIQCAYLWDMYRTGGHHDNFEMASHTIKCSLLFNLR